METISKNSEARTLPAMNAEDLRALCGKGIFALSTFQAKDRPVFFRDSVERSRKGGEAGKEYFPTATSHGILALLDTGAESIRQFSTISPAERGKVFEINDRTDSHILLPKDTKAEFHLLRDRYDSLLTAPDWLTTVIDFSSHSKSDPEDLEAKTRVLLAYGHLIPAVAFLYDHLKKRKEDDGVDTKKLLSGFDACTTRIEALLQGDLDRATYRITMPAHARPPGDPVVAEPLATHHLLHAALALDSILKVSARYSLAISDSSIKSAKLMAERLAISFRRRIDMVMAARGVADDPFFDPVSLVFAMRGAAIFDQGLRDTPLFREAVRAVVDSQLSDGCWPDGAATDAFRGSATQQPSVEIAYHLATCVYSRTARSRPTEAELELMEIATPALQRHARYLELTWIRRDADPIVMGWSSDRARSLLNPETWITALAVRFLLFSALIVESRDRARVLRKFSVTFDRRRPQPDDRKMGSAYFVESVVEPCEVHRPVELIWKTFVRPVEDKIQMDRYVTRPGKSGVSFLLVGPPRSGKTHLVRELAEALRWPLVSLDPGHFNQHGGESVGAMTARVFKRLERLHNTVVLFDECDELLLDRSPAAVPGDATERPLFLTGSLLTRLANLHDERKCIFCFATNHYNKIDPAARGVGRFDAIVFFDRPGKVARHKFLTKQWNKLVREHAKETGNLLADATAIEKGLQSVAEATAGSSYVEIIALLKAILKSKSAVDTITSNPMVSALKTDNWPILFQEHLRTRDDYVDWCKNDGIRDLRVIDGQRLGQIEKKAILQRWYTTANNLKKTDKAQIIKDKALSDLGIVLQEDDR